MMEPYSRGLLGLIGASVVFNALVIGFAWGVLIERPVDGPFFELGKLLPFSVGEVAGERISYRDYGLMVQVMREAGAENPEELAREKLGSIVLLKKIASDAGVDVPEGAGKGEHFGLSDHDYKRLIEEPFLLEQRLHDVVYESDALQTVLQAKRDAIQSQLQDGVPFTDLAVQYSTASTSVIGGDLGSINRSALEFYGLDQDLGIGELTGIDEGRFLHLYQIHAWDSEEGQEMLGLRVITLEKSDLAEVMERYKVMYPLN